MFLVFLKHTQHGEERVLPVPVPTRAQAEQQAAYAYPAYAVLTSYSAPALQQLLADLPTSTVNQSLVDVQAPADTAASAMARRAEVMARLAKTRRQTMLEAMTSTTAETPKVVPADSQHPLPVKQTSSRSQPFVQDVMRNGHDSVSVHTPAMREPAKQPAPSLHAALAVLRQQGARGLAAAVETREEAPVRVAPISRNPAAAAQAAQPKIQRQPAVAAQAPLISRAPQSVIEVFKGLKR